MDVAEVVEWHEGVAATAVVRNNRDDGGKLKEKRQ